jgi:chemotaxis family two-component system sensor kinase Cph1
MEDFQTKTDNYYRDCEKEQLHLSGKIQPHGTLLIVSPDYRVTHFAGNWEEYTGSFFPIREATKLPENFIQMIRHSAVEKGQRQYQWLELPSGNFRVTLFHGEDGSYQLELTRVLEKVGDYVPGQIQNLETAEDVSIEKERITTLVAQRTGFQRVMYYQFREDGDGEVLHEYRQDVYGSFLGLRFPASDIPQIARELYKKNPWRLIVDIDAQPVELFSFQDKKTPDLSHSDLRSVSPVHIAYLKNMGVHSSLSFPVVINEKLVAMIACHHSEPYTPDTAMIEYVAKEVQNHSMALASWKASHRIKMIDEFRYELAKLSEETFASFSGLIRNWDDFSSFMMEKLDCKGVILVFGNQVLDSGKVFPVDVLQTLEQKLRTMEHHTWHTDSLRRSLEEPPLTEICGVLVCSFTDRFQNRGRIYFCREEYIHEVTWGGNPDKPLQDQVPGTPVNPRRSFEKWVEKRLGRSREWSAQNLLFANALHHYLREAYLSG